MNIQNQIIAYIESQESAKRADMEYLHRFILQLMPGCKLWFFDGRDASGKVVSNPNIGYGEILMQNKKGPAKEFYQIGISGNSTGISVYIMGLKDKNFLQESFGSTLGKASISAYCIKFKTLKDIDFDVLGKAILSGIEQTRINKLAN